MYEHSKKINTHSLTSRKLNLLIKLPCSKSIPLKVDPCDRISHLKLRIAEEEGIPPSTQKLTYFFKTLQDDKLLREYHIQNNSILKLSLLTPTPKSISTLNIHSDDGIKYKLKTELDSPISQVKAKIEESFRTKVFHKDVVLNGRLLNERRSLKSYNYTNGDLLYLEDKKITVQFRVSGCQVVTKEFKPEDTVRRVKEVLVEEDVLDSMKSKLYFNGDELRYLSKTLKQCDIQQNSRIFAY